MRRCQTPDRASAKQQQHHLAAPGKRSVQFVNCSCCDSYHVMSDYQGSALKYHGSPGRMKYQSPSDYQSKYQVSHTPPSPTHHHLETKHDPYDKQQNNDSKSSLGNIYAEHLKKQKVPLVSQTKEDVKQQENNQVETKEIGYGGYIKPGQKTGVTNGTSHAEENGVKEQNGIEQEQELSQENNIQNQDTKQQNGGPQTPTKGKLAYDADGKSEVEKNSLPNGNVKMAQNIQNGHADEDKKEMPLQEKKKLKVSKQTPLGSPLPLDEKQSAKQNIFQIMEKVGIELKSIETATEMKTRQHFKYDRNWEIAMNVNNPILQKACENIYEHVKSKDGTVSKQGFMDDLEVRGILRDDPRIAEFIAAFKSSESSMSKDVFTACISRNISVIENAFTNSNIIYDFEGFTSIMKEMFFACKSNETGAMADYIPQLAKQNPDLWGLSVCTIDGQRFNVGDTDVDFCIQSCSKPISYCLALEEHGVDKVHQHVGREPSGIQFNALKLNKIGRPHNPLINSGAIMTCSLIKNHLEPADRFDYVLSKWEQAAGGKPLGYANSVYLSERMTGDRNFALAYFMRENKAFPEGTNIVDVLEFYFQCCSMTITSNYMSIVAATLANGGVCPITGEQVFSAATVKSCLSMMYSCGMYDYSGEFAFNIGLPAKSGVAGGVFVVVPNVMGICTFSPRLDKYGNSARGVDFYSRIITKFNFHLFDNIEMTTSTKQNPRKSKDQDEVTIEKIIKYSSVGDLSALRRLRIKNSDLSVGDYDRRTPLHLAASNGHLNVVKYLYESGGVRDVNPVDRWLGTPYDDAIREGHHEVAEFLKSVGGRKGSGAPA